MPTACLKAELAFWRLKFSTDWLAVLVEKPGVYIIMEVLLEDGARLHDNGDEVVDVGWIIVPAWNDHLSLRLGGLRPLGLPPESLHIVVVAGAAFDVHGASCCRDGLKVQPR